MGKRSANIAPKLLAASIALMCCVSFVGYARADALPAISLPFRNIGPAQTGGRVTAVAGLPGNYNVYYVGSAGGGLWKTVNGGDSWTALFAHGPSPSIGSIAISPKNPRVLWLGTGETDMRNGSIEGAGLFESHNGGTTWHAMGFANAGQISSISVDPEDPQVVVVGVLGHQAGPNTERGVFRTNNGGRSWKKVLYVNSSTGCIQVLRVPGHPNILFAAMWTAMRRPWLTIEAGMGSGIYRSSDGGKTWRKLTRGLPRGPLGRIGLAVAPSHPSKVYALIYAKHGRLWASNDEGNTWSFVSNNHVLSPRPFYFSQIAVSPENENRLYIAGLWLMESNDGGKSVHRIDKGVHSDYHAIWVDPEDGAHIVVGTDGGAFESSDGGRHWRAFKGMPLGQYYEVSATKTLNGAPYIICGGLQDNSGWCGPSSNLNRRNLSGIDWKSVVGGDGNYVVPAPSDPNIIYDTAATVSAGAFYRYNRKTGLAVFARPYWWIANELGPAGVKYRFGLPTPIAVSRTDPNTVYLGANVVFKTTTGGRHWRVISPDLTRNDKSRQRERGKSPIAVEYTTVPDVIFSITIARSNPDVIWVGTDDGLVWVTRDGGAHWNNVTPMLKGTPRWARVYQVGVSPFDAASAYIAMDASRTDNPKVYLYRTHDYGKRWTEIIHGLPPDVPGIVVREDPDKRGLLILGTATSLYDSLNDGGNWSLLSAGFPTTPVWDLHFVKSAHALVVGTHGRGIFTFDNLRPLEEWGDASGKRFYVFKAAPGTLFHRRHWGSPDLPYYHVPNVPTGVRVTYYLKHPESASPVRFEVKNAAGDTIAQGRGAAHRGLNEFTWNLRYAGPTPLNFEKPIFNPPARRHFGAFGPLVVPGRYTIEVRYRGMDQSIPATVRADPRLHIAEERMREYDRDALELRNEVSALDEMVNHIVALRARLGTLQSLPGIGARAAVIDSRLKRIEDEAINPQIQHNVPEDNLHALFKTHGRLTRLFYVVSFSYYQLPDPGMLKAMTLVRRQLESELDEYNEVLKKEIPGLNRALQRAHRAPIMESEEIRIRATPMS